LGWYFNIESDEGTLKEFSSYSIRGDKPAILTDKNILYQDGILNKQKKIPYEDITAVVLYPEELPGVATTNNVDNWINLSLHDKSGEELIFRWRTQYLGDYEKLPNIMEIKDIIINQILNTEGEPPSYKSESEIGVIIPTLKRQVEDVLYEKGVTDEGEFCLPSGAYKESG